jgi:hypothetical protein
VICVRVLCTTAAYIVLHTLTIFIVPIRSIITPKTLHTAVYAEHGFVQFRLISHFYHVCVPRHTLFEWGTMLLIAWSLYLSTMEIVRMPGFILTKNYHTGSGGNYQE